jgi:obg-like ATPase 1
VIHGDFERGFIKAEVVAYQDFHALCEGGKSMGPIKAAGKFRQEGKTYVVQGGDIIHFQFSKLSVPTCVGRRSADMCARCGTS